MARSPQRRDFRVHSACGSMGSILRGDELLATGYLSLKTSWINSLFGSVIFSASISFAEASGFFSHGDKRFLGGGLIRFDPLCAISVTLNLNEN